MRAFDDPKLQELLARMPPATAAEFERRMFRDGEVFFIEDENGFRFVEPEVVELPDRRIDGGARADNAKHSPHIEPACRIAPKGD